MLRMIACVALGSGAGGVLRYLLSRMIVRWVNIEALPVGTLVVNVLGCLLLGMIYGAVERGFDLSLEMRAFLIVGVCGGFTTFSTFAYETTQLFNTSQIIYGILYAVLSFALGLLSLSAGHWLLRTL